MRSRTRRLLPALLTASLLVSACGGGSDAADETDVEIDVDTVVDTQPDVETIEAAPEPEPETTVAEPEPEPETTVVETTEAEPEPEPEVETAGAIEASLSEWAIDAPTEYTAGTITFTAINNGNFPHELVVIAGESYESLPLEEGGAVIEEQLPTGALIGRTERIGSLDTAELTVDLAPGSYVLVCNLGGGANSHAGSGQRLDITVS